MNKPFPDLIGLLDQNPALSKIVLEKFKKNPTYLSYLNKLISELRRLQCQNLTEKIKEPNDLERFFSFTAEITTAKILADHGAKITFLTTDSFEKFSQSPDILGKFSGVPFFFEVNRLKDSHIIQYILDELNEYLQNLPYLVRCHCNVKLSEPVFLREERENQDIIAKRSVAQFKDQIGCIKGENTLFEIKTEGINYSVNHSGTARGYAYFTQEAWIFPDEKFEKYVSDRLLKKACKRSDFKGKDRLIPFILVFLSDDCSIDETDFDDLLYGKIMQYGTEESNLLGASQSDREEGWKDILKDKRKIIPKLCEIESASHFGWKEFLEKRHLIPNNFMYLHKEGLFLSNPLMKNVSGVMLITKSNSAFFYPNPFCYSEINNTEILKILNF